MVSLQRCSSYEEIPKALDRLLETLGGMERFIQPGDRVLIKPNLLMSKRPDAAVTTHPSLIEEIARRVKEAGGHAIIAESPGGPYQKNLLQATYRICGIEEAAARSGAELNLLTDVQEVSFTEGRVAKRFSVIAPFFSCNKLINIGKIKSHGMTYYTGAVKNLFGLIGGLSKAEYHFRYRDKERFCEALVDLCEFAKPTLSILDGVMAMEGDGPSNGTPRHLGVLVASESPYQCDLAALRIIGAKVEDVRVMRHAIRRGLCSAELELAGDPIEEFCVTDFQFPATKSITFEDYIPKFIRRLADRILLPYPKFSKERCVTCMRCAEVCPAKAITLQKGLPHVKHKACIKCYCCQELCPQDAVLLRKKKVK